jgi:mono/diheme cytochrome c family protein
MSQSPRFAPATPRRSRRDGREDHEEQPGVRGLRARRQAFVVVVVVLALVVVAAAQIRPTPQPPPRRTAPPPKTAPQPKRESPEPEEKKPADRGAEAPAPQEPTQERAPQGAALQVSTDPNVNAGAALYKKNGCYECHVNDAQGGPQGPRLGPNPIPMPRFVAYVRNPAGDMPPFTAKVISDDDLAKIYAFLQSRPTPPPVKDIPLLAP